MIYNEDAYYKGYYRNVREIGAVPALVFDTICGLLRNNESGEIANSTLCELLGITAQGLRKIISKLIEMEYIVKSDGIGRGNKTIYMLTEKGKQSCPFMHDKRETSFLKKGNEVSKKEKQSFPLNKDINKELIESGDDMRETQSSALPTTTQQFLDMKDFNLFWDLYPESKNFPHEKENCMKVWSLMQEDWRNKLIKQLQAGAKWREKENDNPIWYLKDYAGQDAKIELPYIRQGSKFFARWMAEHEKKDKIVFIHFEDHGAFCLEKDLKTMENAGAKWVRNWNFLGE